ncbi:hypothetical protein DL98DRAFT_520750 [Cadophora sp. DSE1049]|nr:hypothetical protein DL98DRAFT_520750 [Cadophora sp. DSE1049]
MALPTLPPLPTLLPTIISTILITASIPLIHHPVEFSKNYIHIDNPQSVFFVRQLGTRNLMIGVAIGALVYRGEIASVATVLCCFPLLGILDPVAGWCYRGRFVKNDYNHFILGCLFGGIGWWILGLEEGRV